MPARRNIIQQLGLGPYILELSKSISVRKIAVRLKNEGYLYQGRPLGKSAISDFIKKTKEDGLVLDESAPPVSSEDFDSSAELLDLFTSCKKVFRHQLNAIDQAIQNGKNVDAEAMRTLFTSANSLLRQLDLYASKMEGVLSGAALQMKINEYNILIVQVLNASLEEIFDDESIRKRVRLGFAKALKSTAKQ